MTIRSVHLVLSMFIDRRSAERRTPPMMLAGFMSEAEMAPRVLKCLAVVALFICIAAATVQSQAPNAPNRQAVIDELVIANHILANEGVLDGYGHVSIR